MVTVKKGRVRARHAAAKDQATATVAPRAKAQRTPARAVVRADMNVAKDVVKVAATDVAVAAAAVMVDADAVAAAVKIANAKEVHRQAKVAHRAQAPVPRPHLRRATKDRQAKGNRRKVNPAKVNKVRVRVRVMNIAAARAKAAIVIRVAPVMTAVRRMRVVVAAVKPVPPVAVVVAAETIRVRHPATHPLPHLSRAPWSIPLRRRQTRVIARNRHTRNIAARRPLLRKAVTTSS